MSTPLYGPESGSGKPGLHGRYLGGPFGAGSPFRAGEPVRLVTPEASPLVPALLRHSDRLLIVPRYRLRDPVVYVACARDGMALYVGLTTDLDARRLRHESEVRRGRADSQSGSALVPGSYGVLNATWAAVTVPHEFGPALEQALLVALRPMLQPMRSRAAPKRLDARHHAALLAAGFDESIAERVYQLGRAGLL